MSNFGLKILFWSVLGVALWMAMPAICQEQAIRKVPVAPTAAVDGPTLYKQYCAVCHGTNGKGGGPAASALKASPGDLTVIARKNGGHFPEERFFAILQGESAVAAHGSQDMPMWGPVFRNMSTSTAIAQTRMHALLDYVEKMQVK
jgi:mono/diheme cytochrome c family protein